MTVQGKVEMTDRNVAAVENRDNVAAEGDESTRAFWTNELEVAYDQVLEQAIQPDFADAWIGKRTGRQVDILRRNLGMAEVGTGRGQVQAKKDELRANHDELRTHVLVHEFAKCKAKRAVIEVAQRVLPADVLAMCRQGDDNYDTLALCFAIYGHDARVLPSILHLDRIHKTGFARMRMKGNRRRPSRSLADFLTGQTVQQILVRYDRSKGDGRTSEFKNVMAHEHRHLVFIRRCERPSRIMRGHGIVHGYRPEWIVLVYFDGAKRVNISSLSVQDSLEIADRIASEYYGTDCEYENDREITYARQLERFLSHLRSGADEELALVELVVGNTPLDGSPSMTLTHRQSRPIGPALAQFEQAIGDVLSTLDNIESMKVLYRGKRVKLILEKVDQTDDEYVVRYSDHQLNPLERLSFEGYMGNTHAIPVLSTEKRFKRPTS